MENRRISVWKDEISLSLLQRYHDRGFLQDEILTLSKSRQSLLLLLLSRFSCVRLCATPETAAQ